MHVAVLALGSQGVSRQLVVPVAEDALAVAASEAVRVKASLANKNRRLCSERVTTLVAARLAVLTEKAMLATQVGTLDASPADPAAETLRVEGRTVCSDDSPADRSGAAGAKRRGIFQLVAGRADEAVLGEVLP